MIIRNMFGSLVRFCQDQIDFIKDVGLSSDMTFINLDAHAAIHELEQIDYLGIAGFQCEVDDKIHTVNLGVCVTLANDPTLLRHMAVMDVLYDALQPEKSLAYYDADTAVPKSWFFVTNGTQLLPVARSELRVIQLISVTMLLNPAADKVVL